MTDRAHAELRKLGFDVDQLDARLVERVRDHLDAPQRLRDVLDREARGDPAPERDMHVPGLPSRDANRALRNRRHEIRSLYRRAGQQAAYDRANEALGELLGYLPNHPPVPEVTESPRQLGARLAGADDEPEPDDDTDPRTIADQLRGE